MIARRRVILTGGAIVLTAPFASSAQPKSKVWRIGFLGPGTSQGLASRLAAIKTGLRALGYADGKNVVFEERWTDNDNATLPKLAADLVAANCDVIVTTGTPSIIALKAATSIVPLVVVTSGDMVRLGIVTSLARPGGNVTGISAFGPELYGKRLEILKEMNPRLKMVGLLTNPTNSGSNLNLTQGNLAAKFLKVQLLVFEVQSVGGLGAAFGEMEKKRIGALLLSQDTLFLNNLATVASLSTKHRLPSIGPIEFVDAGGMLGYGPNIIAAYERVAAYVDRIFKGDQPGQIPIEQPTQFELAVNNKTATALKIKIPQSILLRADKVIE